MQAPVVGVLPMPPRTLASAARSSVSLIDRSWMVSVFIVVLLGL
jgi:hypothetical protein